MNRCIALALVAISAAAVADESAPLSRSTDPPGPFTLIAPGGWDLPMRPTFFWTASENASLYTITVDDEPTLTPPHVAVAETSATSYQFPPYTLAPILNLHYWRVVASNEGPFTTVGTPNPKSFNMVYLGCPGDANGDVYINFADVTSALANFGGGDGLGDADMNGAVNFADITCILANWGQPCY